MKKVVVYRHSFLALSEAFIKEQILAYQRWKGILIGMRRVSNGVALNDLHIFQLRPDHPGKVNRVIWRISREFGTLPFHVFRRLKHASLIHVHFGTDAVEAWPLAEALNLPMLVTLHGYDISARREWWEKQQDEWANRYPARLLELARQPRVRFIAVSESIRERAISFGIPAHKLSVNYIGIDPTKFAPQGRPIADRDPRVLFVGRLVEIKGCEYLIKAFVAVQKSVPNAALVIIGDGERRDGLQDLARQLDVRAQFFGAATHTVVRQELNTARVLCLPSITIANGHAEGFGMVLLEAQASGVPVVTSATAGSVEGIVDGVTGFAFPEKDIEALAAKIIVLLNDDRIAVSMAAAGPRFVADKFDIVQCTNKLELIYDAFVRGELS